MVETKEQREQEDLEEFLTQEEVGGIRGGALASRAAVQLTARKLCATIALYHSASSMEPALPLLFHPRRGEVLLGFLPHLVVMLFVSYSYLEHTSQFSTPTRQHTTPACSPLSLFGR